MFAKIFVPMFFGAAYASAWWGFAIYKIDEFLFMGVFFGVALFFWLTVAVIEDLNK